MRVIRIEQGNEFKIINRQIEKNDLFLAQYQIAAAHVEEIVSAETDVAQNQTDHLNNIIAFTGERGQGKSSAMQNFAEALVRRNCEISFGEKTIRTNFIKLDTIDPSTFENIHNIIEVVVARMFNTIKDISIGNDNNAIINLFQKVYECLSLIRSPKKLEELEYDFEGSIQKIAHIGDSTKLRNYMCKLVEKYLEIVGEPDKPDFLIIPIDDLDINIEFAYKMAEQIRKYLLIPKVIIIMAIKIDQLRYCVELQYRKELDVLIKADNRLNRQEPISMASKYIEKLIPDGRKINLPEIKILASNNNDRTEIEYILKYKKENDEIVQENLLEKYKTYGIEKTILGYLYERTGLIFIKPEDRVHPLIPNTMRELVNLMSILGKMNDGKLLDNVIAFEHYMLYTWIPNNLDDGYIRIIKSCFSEHELAIHSFLCPALINILETYKIYTLDIRNENEFDDIKTRFASKGLMDYSLGDVITLLNFIEKRYHDNEVRSFVFAVKTLLSITMRKMIIKNLHSETEQANEVYRFVNGSVWGVDIRKVRRQGNFSASRYLYSTKRVASVMQASAERNISRAVFEYDVSSLFNLELATSDRVSVENLSQEQIDLICYVLFFSNFDKYDVFISENSIFRKKAEFTIENLLISSLDLDNLPTKWGYQLDRRIKNSIETLKNSINVNLISDIVTNIELSEYVFKYCVDKKGIKSKATDEEHFINFVNNIEKAIKSDNINYIFFNNDQCVFREGYNWAIKFYVECFTSIEMAGKVVNEIDKKEIEKVNSEFLSITQIWRKCSLSTLIRKIDDIINIFSKSNAYMIEQSILIRLNSLKATCNKLIISDPKAYITDGMKEEYNSIYNDILKMISKWSD